VVSEREAVPPDMDPETFRALGYRVVDEMAHWLAGEAADPVLEPISGEWLRALLEEPPPRAASPTDDVLQTFRDVIARYSRRNGHPRYLAYVSASAAPAAVLADALASMLNQNVTAWRSAPAAAAVERRVIAWLGELTGFGACEGLLLGGGSAANLHALGCAIARAGSRRPDVARERFAVYTSTQTHLSLDKAARFLGLGPVRALAVDERRRLRPDALREAIRADREAGLVPALVCGSAGTANTGTIDPLAEIAAVCRDQAVWFHVDGAYGAPAALTDGYAWLRDDFSQADSLSLDPHKWLYAPLDAGCLLVRDGAAARAAYSRTAAYIAVSQTAPEENHAFWDYGLELSRRFRALKIWFLFKLHGVDAIARSIDANIDVRRHLDRLIDAEPKLEPLGSELSISCFRYRRPGLDATALDRVNRRILEDLLAGGGALLSPTTLDGRFALRICIVNFRTRLADMEWLAREVVRLGDAV